MHRGDVAIFAYPNDRSVRYTKRVIALPGDLVEFKNRQFTVNGQPLQTPHGRETAGSYYEETDGHRWQVQHLGMAEPTQTDATIPPLNRAPVKQGTQLSLCVPDGQAFVSCDNRNPSVDSRTFGTVALQDILGRARRFWLSYDQGTIKWERIGAVVRQPRMI